MGKYGGQTMEHEELNKKECNENSDRFIKDALNEETKKESIDNILNRFYN